MITRNIEKKVRIALERQAAVALLGPRQAGKTTLAHEIALTRPSVYLDLESKRDRDMLSDPVLFCKKNEDKLIILDEIQRVPELFQELRGIIDEGRRKGFGIGRFLILGSASIDLLQQSGETLAGRIEYIPLNPINILEIPEKQQDQLWIQGGFPGSFLAKNEEDSFALRCSFIKTYLERDIPMFGSRVPAEVLERLWTMLAHGQGSLLNASNLASGLGLAVPTVTHYISLFVDLLLVRRLMPFHSNLGKRLIKSPKIYIRDSGLLHALLGIRTFNELLGHPIVGLSFEGFVIENLLSVAPDYVKASFYRTPRGAEVDLILELGGNHGKWAIEIKKGYAPKLEKGFYMALEDIQPTKAFVIHGGQERYPKNKDVEAISLTELAEEIALQRS
jgi:predicted AAA+ superfamily ATPase